MALSESNETESKRKKRKADDKLVPSSKKSKVGDDSEFVPLPPGWQVVVRPIQQDYILAIVVRWLPDKQKYEVEDAEDDEEKPGTRKVYVFPAKLVIPIPKEVNKKDEFPANHTVLALYPNSSCFYKATVLKPPSKNQDEDYPGHYVLRFEDDGGFDRYVNPCMVLDMPKGNPKLRKQ
ncbi:hypothetical protein HDV05_008424 [Chytridiales sp. JEL 0842]|nr:hypothetical protein HDV05_008424 [Chytridiales sp. JEL 0842]